MQMSKKAQIGGGLTLFAATIIILILLIIFTISSYFIKEFTDTKSGVESVELLEISDYINNFKNQYEKKPTSIYKTQECEPTKEIFNKYLGECVCNAEGGWTNKDNPWKSFRPTCIHQNQLNTRHAIDTSLDLETNNPQDKGACIGYYNLKYTYSQLNKNKPSNEILELLNYNFLNGYVNKVDDTFMQTTQQKESKETYTIIDRNLCLRYASSYRTKNYVIFYNTHINNLNQGNIDDIGYCVGFKKDKTELNPYFKITREDCKLTDNADTSSDYSFFLTQKGQEPITISELFEDYIILETFSNFFETENNPQQEQITKQEIKEICPEYRENDLIFFRAIKDLIQELDENEIEDLLKRRARSACSIYWQEIRNKKRQENDFTLDGPYKFEYEIINKLNGEFCCYGKKV